MGNHSLMGVQADFFGLTLPSTNIYMLTLAVLAFGAIGGAVNCLLIGTHRFLPHHDDDKVWHLGWFGSMIIGAVAAVVIWGIYGPMASYDVASAEDKTALHLTIAQLLTSLLVGISGSRILTSEAQKQILKVQRDGSESAKNKVAEAFAERVEEEPDESETAEEADQTEETAETEETDAHGQSESSPPP